VIHSQPGPLDPAIEKLLEHPAEKPYKDLRDRVAFMYITGCFPSHLRETASHWLRLVSTPSRSLSALDGQGGVMAVLQPVAIRLALEDHPMVAKARAKIADGYRITASRGPNARRPFGKIFLSRRGVTREERIAVKIDGSVLDHWK
jgi:uncharacterized HAD superfamily protein